MKTKTFRARNNILSDDILIRYQWDRLGIFPLVNISFVNVNKSTILLYALSLFLSKIQYDISPYLN